MRKLRGGVKDCENGNGDQRVEEGKRDRGRVGSIDGKSKYKCREELKVVMGVLNGNAEGCEEGRIGRERGGGASGGSWIEEEPGTKGAHI